MTAYLPEWAWSAACLGWLYAALGFFWPRLFHRDVLAHAVREPLGYRLGRAVYWQLPVRTAIAVGLAALIPILAMLFLPDTLAVMTLTVFTGAELVLWLSAPPGQRLGIVEISPPGDAAAFALRSGSQHLRAVAVLALFGLAPAITFGLLLRALWAMLAA